MTSFGRHLGLAYQIIDDLLDLSDNTGKSKGKDREVGKLTYLSGMTQAEAKVYANAATDQAIAVLNDMPCPNRERRKALSQYANQLLRRDY
mgnify:FL=1